MTLTKPCAAAIASLLIAACTRGPDFQADRISAAVRMLASDEFAGRAPASAGEQKTVTYLVNQMEAAGLTPGGELQPDGTRAWTQAVPLVRYETTGPVSVQVRAGRDALTWTQGEQVAIRPSQAGTDHVQLDGAPIVFVGYGVYAPERNWDDFKGMDLKGKVALMLVNDPDFETGEGDFGGKAMTYYGRWTYKYEEAARRGAAGALVIHETEPASYGWAIVNNSNTSAEFDVVRADPLAVHVPVEGWIQRDATVDLFKRAGLDFEMLKAEARKRAFTPVTLPAMRISVDLHVRRQPVRSSNVIGVLTGRKYPDEWLLYTAHWDHLGVVPGANGGDSIYNGAVDNGTGLAVLVEIARNFARTGRADRSVGFLFVTAEEQGLLGSEYYAGNPLYPLAKTVADINTDALRPLAPATDFSTRGNVPSELQDQIVQVGEKLGRSFTPDSNPAAGYFYRSDHFSFAKRGVPALSFTSGDNPRGSAPGAGDAWDKMFRAERYHQPGDEIGTDWRSDGLAADALMQYTLGRQLADSHAWPQWRQGAEFKAVRDATAAERE